MSEATQTQTSTDSFESTAAEVGRMVKTGTVWFSAAVISVAIAIPTLLSSGWRPSDLAAPEGFAWWFGSFLALVGVAGLAWAGCPVMGFPLHAAHQQKAVCMRGGTVLFIGGSVIALMAILLSPAG